MIIWGGSTSDDSGRDGGVYSPQEAPPITPTRQAFTFNGGVGSVRVAAASDCVWTAQSNVNWISLGASGGSGPGAISFTVAPNNTVSARTGTMTIATRIFTVTQDGCTANIAPASQAFEPGGGTGSIAVTATGNCGWTAQSNANWIMITAGASGSGNGTVTFAVAANTGASPRAGTIALAGQTFNVTQVQCSFMIAPVSQAFTAGGGAGSVNITAQSGCGWTAQSNASWLTISSANSGSGNGMINFTVAANTNTTSRNATLTIAGQTFTVTQAGCTLTISPASQSFEPMGGTGSIIVTAAGGCAWTATSNANWLTITSGSSGAGSGAVSYSVAVNTSSGPRTGTLLIADQTFTVTQVGVRLF
jgi:hypothetical protein